MIANAIVVLKYTYKKTRAKHGFCKLVNACLQPTRAVLLPAGVEKKKLRYSCFKFLNLRLTKLESICIADEVLRQQQFTIIFIT
jgi:hypothetical protein